MNLAAHAKSAVLVLLATTLSSCATTEEKSRTASYSVKGEQLVIQVTKGSAGINSSEFAILVNGQSVAKGITSFTRPLANMTGMYRKIKIDAECKVAVGNTMRSECAIYADGNKVGDFAL